MDLTKLRDPFPASDIEWRIQSAGEKDGKVWARVLAYVTSRAIMERLDEVVGPENWQTAFRQLGNSISCGIGIRCGEEWVWKWDGAGHLAASDGLSESDAGKGDYSNALKRAGYQWGIGRYLYNLPESFANVHPGGANYGRTPKHKGDKAFRWDPPELPAWALPGGSGRPPAKQYGARREGAGSTNGYGRRPASPAPKPRDELHGLLRRLDAAKPLSERDIMIIARAREIVGDAEASDDQLRAAIRHVRPIVEAATTREAS